MHRRHQATWIERHPQRSPDNPQGPQREPLMGRIERSAYAKADLISHFIYLAGEAGETIADRFLDRAQESFGPPQFADWATGTANLGAV